MIEREFVAQKTKEYYIKKFIESKLSKVGLSSIKLKKIPMGEKIIIETSKPSLIVGSKGTNIKELTLTLKKEFKLENPQIEINEVKNIFLDPIIVADKIAGSLERFGSARFKGVGHKIMENVINSGALGIEIVLSGKIPSARAKSWRFYQGYLKKCGQSATEIKSAYAYAQLKSGTVGIQVRIMPPNLILPDDISIKDDELIQQESLAQAAKSSKESEKAAAGEEIASSQEASQGSEDKKEKKPRKKRAPKTSKSKEEDAKSSDTTEKTDADSAETTDQASE